MRTTDRGNGGVIVRPCGYGSLVSAELDEPRVAAAVDREDVTEVPDEARTRHRDLSEELDRYAFAYYVQDAPLVSDGQYDELMGELKAIEAAQDRKSTRLNSSHANISYAVFCLKKKNHRRHAV